MDRKTNSTWREQTLTLPPKTVYDVVFPDTKPNHYHINNLSAAPIYLGVSVLASPKSYDIAVTGNGDNIHARDLGVTRITLYNDSPDKARIVLTTFEDKFNPAVLAGRGGSVTVSGGGGGGGAGGVITGFNASLPSGDNNIGRVKVTEMPAIDFALSTLPAGSNMIGKVEVAKLPPLASVNGKIGDVGILGGVTITSMPPVTVTDKATSDKHISWDAYVAKTVESFTIPTGLTRFVFITNDGNTDLYIMFDSLTATETSNRGLNGYILLRPGETLNDLTRVANKINFVRKDGAGTVRFLVV